MSQLYETSFGQASLLWKQRVELLPEFCDSSEISLVCTTRFQIPPWVDGEICESRG